MLHAGLANPPPPLSVLESWMLDAHLCAFDLTCSIGAEMPFLFSGGPCPFFCGLSSHILGGGVGVRREGWIWLSRNVMDILVWRPLLTERCSLDNKPCALWHFLPSKEGIRDFRSFLVGIASLLSWHKENIMYLLALT